MTKKPKTVTDWEKVCSNLNAALQLSMRDEEELIKELEAEKNANNILKKNVSDLEQSVKQLSELLANGYSRNEKKDELIDDMKIAITKSAGIIQYLEKKLERSNSI
jgi:hypothetical protein